MSCDEFIARMLPSALAAQDEWGVLPSVLLAQACLESAYGTRLPAPHNYLGLKDLPFDRGSRRNRTVEDPRREGPAIEAAFEDFRDPTHCCLAYGRLLARSPNYIAYRQALPDPIACAKALQGVYAADVRYAEKLIGLMGQHRLYQYDVEG